MTWDEIAKENSELKRRLTSTHRKIQEWWWRIQQGWIDRSELDSDAIQDMESFMRERSIPLERPK